MLKVRSGSEIYVSLEPIDMRKSINGITIMVQQVFSKPLQGGNLYVFFNRDRDKAKVLWWDRNGFALHYKRLERHRFVVPTPNGNNQVSINETQLNGLLAGLDFTLMGEFEEIEYDKLF